MHEEFRKNNKHLRERTSRSILVKSIVHELIKFSTREKKDTAKQNWECGTADWDIKIINEDE